MKQRATAVLILVCFLGGCTGKNPVQTQDTAAFRGFEGLPILEIRMEPTHRLFPDRDSGKSENEAAPGIIFRLFSDGDMIYSKNDLSGGPPYHKTTIKLEAINKYFNELESNGVFEGKDWIFNCGVDSAYTKITMRYSGKKFQFFSWHELFGNNPKLVVTDRGVSPLGDRSIEEVHANMSQEYKEFLRKWDLIRKGAKELVE